MYDTKQRRSLLDFFAAHPDEALTAGQIAAAVNAQGVSASAVYRNLAALERDGKVRRVSRAGCREALYQYTDGAACRGCLHLSCKKCGRTYHMNMLEADMLVRRVARQDNFTIDKTDTILYGICGACREAAV